MKKLFMITLASMLTMGAVLKADDLPIITDNVPDKQPCGGSNCPAAPHEPVVIILDARKGIAVILEDGKLVTKTISTIGTRR